MASENNIKRVLDLLTVAPKAHIEALSFDAANHVRVIQDIVNDNNVVALGISNKISGKKSTGKLALVFYVEKKIPLKQLAGDQVIPPTVPESISGSRAIPTDVIVIGKIKPEAKSAGLPFINLTVLQPGNSIGHIDIGAGTLGAVVTDGKERYLLSNSHVLANSGNGKKGDGILNPGNTDGGVSPADIVANLTRFVPFNPGKEFVNLVDCAIAKPLASKLPLLNPEIRSLGLPKGVIAPKRGMKVIKVGRTTGKTSGVIEDIHFRFVLTYDDPIGDVGYKEQVKCSRYTDVGDSGSLVIDKASGKAVGLHFAGANGGSIFSPITEVLKALKVKLVTKGVKSKNLKSRKKPVKENTKNKHAIRKSSEQGAKRTRE